MMLGDLRNNRIFYYFEQISSIPHGSGNTKAVSDYCASVAEKLGLCYRQDELNNIIIYKNGSVGREGEQPIILQGHLDMVCEKDPEKTFDFSKVFCFLGIINKSVCKGLTKTKKGVAKSEDL